MLTLSISVLRAASGRSASAWRVLPTASRHFPSQGPVAHRTQNDMVDLARLPQAEHFDKKRVSNEYPQEMHFDMQFEMHVSERFAILYLIQVPQSAICGSTHMCA